MGRGWLYEFSLLWVFPVVWSGYKHKIDDPNRVPELPDVLKSQALVDRAQALWEEEVAKAAKAEETKKRKKPSLFNVVYALNRPYFFVGMIMSVIQGLVTTVVRPLLIRQLVQELGGAADQKQLLLYVGYLAIALVAEGWSSVSLKHAFSDYLGSIWFTAVGSLIQRKSLRIPFGTTTMEETSLLGNDILRAYENQRFASILPMALISLIGGVVVLVITIGEASIIGLVVMVVILAVNARIAKKAQIAEEKDLEASDSRLSLMTQIIYGIKAIKLSAWEDSFLELIRKARQHEMKCLETYRTLHQSSVQLGRACPALCAGVSFIYMATTGENISAADLFAALNVFLALRLPLIVIPESVTYVGGYIVSFRRIEKYLQLEEVSSPGAPPDPSYESLHIKGTYLWHSALTSTSSAAKPTPKDSKDPKDQAETASAGHVEMQESFNFQSSSSKTFSSAQLSFGTFSLQDLDINIPRGCRCAVIGSVGSGKSSFLHALAGELKEVSGSPLAENTFAFVPRGYVPQHAFVLSGTIRENITLGRTPDGDQDQEQAKFNDVLQRSALLEDLKFFPQGLETAVGERGVTLSGGQQARLTVARALFAEPELLLADDPLAAVDATVADQLVQSIVREHQPGRTLVVALNQIRFLKEFDYVIQLENGRVVRSETITPAVLEVIRSEEFDHRKEAIKEAESRPLPPESMPGGLETSTDALQDDTIVRDGSTMSQQHRESSSMSQRSREDAQEGDYELVKKEHRNTGVVSRKVITTYMKGMGWHYLASGLTIGVITYSIMALNDLWLASFVKIQDPTRNDSVRFAVVYASGCVCFLICLLLTSIIFSRAGVRSSQNLHDHCMNRILHAPITWFESTPSGRILSRFSTDIGIVDQVLSRFTDNLFQLLATVAALVVVVCVLVPPVTIVIVVSAIFYSFQVMAVDKSNREIKREANLAMSPVQTILNESVNGRISIRAFGANEIFESKFREACDAWNRQSFTSLSIVNMSMLASYGLSFFISTATGLFIVLGDKDPSDSGLALTYSLLIPYFALHCAFVFTIVQNALASLERVLDFVGDSVPQEPEWRLVTDPFTRMRIEKARTLAIAQTSVQQETPPESELWPSAGAIEFQKVTLIYRPGLPPALRDLSFSIRAGERVAIVGRTGAGKSSALLVLFRIMEPAKGRILIDGVDTSTLGLVTLREAFSIIPQTPLLIRGTVRKNLSPFGGHDDTVLANALQSAGLVDSMESAMKLLDLDVGSNASLLSAGQRQLLSFARTLLRPGAIRVCDEPTSNVDESSDAAIQRVLRSQAGTTIVIAHRINTIIDSDRILVLEHGKMVEFDTPERLLANPRGHFYKMAKSHDQEH